MINGPSVRERKHLWLTITGASDSLQQNSPSSFNLENFNSETQVCSKRPAEDLEQSFPFEPDMHKIWIKQSMETVLQAYAASHPDIEYCLGLNCLAGRLLSLGYDDKKCFAMLTAITEHYLPEGYFTEPDILARDVKVLENLLSRQAPKLARHLIKTGVNISAFVAPWLV